MYLSIASDNLLVLDNLQNSTGQLISDATVKARVLKYDGTVIAEDINLLLFSEGRYEGVLQEVDAAKLQENTRYDVEITADRNGGEIVAVFRCRYPAKWQCN